jgi:hypothetical protein
VGTGELFRDGLPGIPVLSNLKERASVGRKAGSEFLNVEFGWKPLVSDIRSLANAVIRHEKILKQFHRDSGRVVRRRFYFPDETIEGTPGPGSLSLNTAITNETPWLNAFTAGGTATPSISKTTVRRKWFSGAYTFFMHDSTHGAIASAESAAQKARLLLGLDLNPETLWQLSPWSWLADWVGNVGDNLSNVTRLSNDSLVIQYGYMMCSTSTEMVRAGSVPLRDGGYVQVVDRSRKITKERQRATPYGFGLNTSAFSATQWAILGALGMTRAPRTLESND